MATGLERALDMAERTSATASEDRLELKLKMREEIVKLNRRLCLIYLLAEYELTRNWNDHFSFQIAICLTTDSELHRSGLDFLVVS